MDDIDRALREVSKRTLRMRLSNWKEFFCEDGKEYRLGIAGINGVALMLDTATFLLLRATSLSTPAWLGLSVLISAVVEGVAMFCTVAILDEVR